MDTGGDCTLLVWRFCVSELPEQGEELSSKSRLSVQECQMRFLEAVAIGRSWERKIRKQREEQRRPRGGFLGPFPLSDLPPPPGSLPSSRRKFMANCFKRRRGSTWCTNYNRSSGLLEAGVVVRQILRRHRNDVSLSLSLSLSSFSQGDTDDSRNGK